MKAIEVTEPGLYWCSHDIAYWVPDKSAYPTRWTILERGDQDVFWSPGSGVSVHVSEIPDYVTMVGPLEPPKSL